MQAAAWYSALRSAGDHERSPAEREREVRRQLVAGDDEDSRRCEGAPLR